MKKVFFSALLLLGFYVVSAQADSLQQYTGKYKFPEGSPVGLLTVTLENGSLYGTSDAGSSTLTRSKGDVFSVDAYGGVATFKRSADNKITGIRIEVEETVMEGTREAAAFNYECAFFTKQQLSDLVLSL